MDILLKKLLESAKNIHRMELFESFCKQLTSDTVLIESITSGVALIENYTQTLDRSRDAKYNEKFRDNNYVSKLFNELRALKSGDTSLNLDSYETNVKPYDAREDRLDKREMSDESREKLNDELESRRSREENKTATAIPRRIENIKYQILVASYKTMFHLARTYAKQGKGGGDPEIVDAIVGGFAELLMTDEFINNVADRLPTTDEETNDGNAYYGFLKRQLTQKGPRIAKAARNDIKNIDRTSKTDVIQWVKGYEVINLRIPEWREFVKANKVKNTLPNIIQYRNSRYKLAPGVDGLSPDRNIQTPEDNEGNWILVDSETTSVSMDAEVGSGDNKSTVGDSLVAPGDSDATTDLMIEDAIAFIKETINDPEYMSDVISESKRPNKVPAAITGEQAVKYFSNYDIDTVINFVGGGSLPNTVDDATLLEIFGPGIIKIAEDTGKIARSSLNNIAYLKNAYKTKVAMDNKAKVDADMKSDMKKSMTTDTDMSI